MKIRELRTMSFGERGKEIGHLRKLIGELNKQNQELLRQNAAAREALEKVAGMVHEAHLEARVNGRPGESTLKRLDHAAQKTAGRVPATDASLWPDLHLDGEMFP